LREHPSFGHDFESGHAVVAGTFNHVEDRAELADQVDAAIGRQRRFREATAALRLVARLGWRERRRRRGRRRDYLVKVTRQAKLTFAGVPGEAIFCRIDHIHDPLCWLTSAVLQGPPRSFLGRGVGREKPRNAPSISAVESSCAQMRSG
jgi:hypothetical protein